MLPLFFFTPADEEKLRDQVLKWRDESWNLIQKDNIFHYLTQPSLNSIYLKTTDRKKHNAISPYFWYTVDVQPNLEKTALENMANLLDAILKKLEVWQHQVLRLDEIFSLPNHELMHGFRKHLRSIQRLLEYFPSVIKTNNNDVRQGMDVINTLYRLYGDLNDAWTAYDFYDKKKNESTEMMSFYVVARKKVDVGWKDLTFKQKYNIDLNKAVHLLQSHLSIN